MFVEVDRIFVRPEQSLVVSMMYDSVLNPGLFAKSGVTSDTVWTRKLSANNGQTLFFSD